jgi:hypothetical protein
MDEQLSPDRAWRLLRAKAGELEHHARGSLGHSGRLELTGDDYGQLLADIALIATLLADVIERPRHTHG